MTHNLLACTQFHEVSRGGIWMVIESLYTVTEAAEILRVSPWTVRSWLAKGRIQRKKLGSRVVITDTQLREVIERGLSLPEMAQVPLERHDKVDNKLYSTGEKAADSRSAARGVPRVRDEATH